MEIYRRNRQNCMTSEFDYITTQTDYDEEYDSALYGDIFDMYDLLMKLSAEDYRNIKSSMKDKGCFFTNYYGKIVYCNEKWLSMCKYSKYEVLNKTPKILQGKNTNMEICETFMKELHKNGSSLMENINYTNENDEIKVKICAKKINFDDQNINQKDKNLPYFFSTFELVDTD